MLFLRIMFRTFFGPFTDGPLGMYPKEGSFSVKFKTASFLVKRARKNHAEYKVRVAAAETEEPSEELDF